MHSHQSVSSRPAPAPVSKAIRQKLTFGDPVLDRLLRGGIPCGLITELAGEAAAGKSQACLQLLLNAQLPLDKGGFDGSALYIYTEGNASLTRLQQLVDARGWSRDPEVMQRIIVKQGPGLADGQALLDALHEAQPLLADRSGRRIRLMVVDSIAAVFRHVGDNRGVRQVAHRSDQLCEVATLLRRYAQEHNLAVVVTNQVTDVFEDGGDAALRKACATAGLDLWTSGRRVLPALGLAWTNCVNQRLFLARTQRGDGGGGVLRQACVVFSPYLPQRDCYYRVEQAGLRGLKPEEVQHPEGIASGSEVSTAAAAAAQQTGGQHVPHAPTAVAVGRCDFAAGEAGTAAERCGAGDADTDGATADDAAQPALSPAACTSVHSNGEILTRADGDSAAAGDLAATPPAETVAAGGAGMHTDAAACGFTAGSAAPACVRAQSRVHAGGGVNGTWPPTYWGSSMAASTAT